jgi:hypothetical protein
VSVVALSDLVNATCPDFMPQVAQRDFWQEIRPWGRKAVAIRDFWQETGRAARAAKRTAAKPGGGANPVATDHAAGSRLTTIASPTLDEGRPWTSSS